MLTVGGHEQRFNKGNATLQWMPISQNRYFGVELQEVKLGTKVLAQGTQDFGTAVVDSGTTFTYFPGEVYAGFLAAVNAACEGGGCDAWPAGSNCWRLNSGGTSPHGFPTATMAFSGVDGDIVLRWPPEAYLFSRGEADLWCPAFADNGNQVQTVLGVSFFLHKNIVFDTETSRLGVSEADCPEHRRPPGIETDGFTASTEFVPMDSQQAQQAQRREVGIALLCLAGLLAVVSAAMAASACGWCKTCGQRDYDSLEPGQKNRSVQVAPGARATP